MINPFKHLIATINNPFYGRRHKMANLDLGLRVIDYQVTRRRVELTTTQRSMHIAVLGKSGSGKSSLLKYMPLLFANRYRKLLEKMS